MHYHDELYGEVDVSESVLVDLIASDALQRTKGVSQHGVTALLGITPPFSRFDHSVGAMLLVRRLGAPIGEQVAALLHDVSHTAFSHVIDFVFDDHSGQSYHEEKKEEYLLGSDVPEILDSHGLDWRDFLDEAKFPLLEQPSPALCADRMDYFLRDVEFLRLGTQGEIQAALQSLGTREGKIVIFDLDVARWLAYTFIEADRASWSSFREVGLYQLTAEAIKAAFGRGLIGDADLWGSDEALWEKLGTAGDSELKRMVRLISPGTRFIWDDNNPAFRVATKVRSIDPTIVCGDSVAPLSVLDADFGRYRAEYLASKKGRWPMGVVPAA